MDKITEVQSQALEAIAAAQDLNALQQARITYLGKKGLIQSLMSEMKALPKEEKPAFGQKVNICKQEVTRRGRKNSPDRLYPRSWRTRRSTSRWKATD